MIISKINLLPYSFYIEYDDFNIDVDIDFDLPDKSRERLEIVSSAFTSKGELERFEKEIKRTVAECIKQAHFTNAPPPYGRGQNIRKNSTYSTGVEYPYPFPKDIESTNFMLQYVDRFKLKEKWNWNFDLIYKDKGKWVVTDISFAPQLRLTCNHDLSSKQLTGDDLSETDHSSPLAYLNLRGQSIIARVTTSPIDIEYVLDKPTLQWLEKTVLSCVCEGEIEEFDRSIRNMVRAAVHELSNDDSINISVGSTLNWQYQDWEELKGYEFTFTVPSENKLIVTKIKAIDL